jgi:hypothetical protein
LNWRNWYGLLRLSTDNLVVWSILSAAKFIEVWILKIDAAKVVAGLVVYALNL